MTNAEARAYDPARRVEINRLEAQIKELNRVLEGKKQELREWYGTYTKG